MRRDLGGSKARRGGDEAIAFPGPKIPRVYGQVIWSWGHRRTHAHTHASGGGQKRRKKKATQRVKCTRTMHSGSAK